MTSKQKLTGLTARPTLLLAELAWSPVRSIRPYQG